MNIKANIIRPNRSGFTLIEIMFVLVILGVLAAIAQNKLVDLGNSTENWAIEVGIMELNAREKLTRTDFKLSSSGWTNDNAVFSAMDLNLSAGICGVIESLVSKEKTVIFRSIEDMVERILHLTNNPEIALLIIKNKEELLQLYSSLNGLRRAEMLLILSDRNPETIELGYKLKPQFSTCLHNDFMVIQTVLKQMLLSLLVKG